MGHHEMNMKYSIAVVVTYMRMFCLLLCFLCFILCLQPRGHSYFGACPWETTLFEHLARLSVALLMVAFSGWPEHLAHIRVVLVDGKPGSKRKEESRTVRFNIYLVLAPAVGGDVESLPSAVISPFCACSFCLGAAFSALRRSLSPRSPVMSISSCPLTAFNSENCGHCGSGRGHLCPVIRLTFF